jgi:FKBP-type peptidyl-prolyl cis-trans isomerase SlyD
MGVQVISFHCVLKNKLGTLISSTFNRDVITSLDGSRVILQGLATGLQSVQKGEKRKITLTAEQAYGLYEPKKVILFPKKKLPRTVRVGEFVSVLLKNGETRSYRVDQIHGDLVSLDGNHPLAGQDLIFEIETLEARDATAEEIEQSVNFVSTQTLH